MIKFNEFQSTLESLNYDSLPDETKDKFMECITCIPFISYMISPNRKRAKDLPRDKEGRIIVDICHPHILEDMDYFRPSAIHFQKYGCYTKLRPNGNPNSEFGKWVKEEVRRCWEGYVRPSDGEWVTGELYFYLNYSPMELTRVRKGTKIGDRVRDFPDVWDGVYLRYHYQWQARNGGLYDKMGGHHCFELASRGKSKSYCASSQLARIFTVGDSAETCKGVKAIITAYQKEYLTKDATLNKFESNIDFLAQHTEFPRHRLQSSLDKMSWQMGYIDLNTGTKKGTLNTIYGVTSKDNADKLRGKRPIKILLEEAGTFPKLKEIYATILPSVEEGDFSFGQISGFGTSGDPKSDFTAMQEFMYNPLGYNMYALPNVFDINPTKFFVWFYGAYLNRKDCYDHNGNSDVTKALVSILNARHFKKYNSTDLNAVSKLIAEHPITPREAIIRNATNIFPVQLLTDRLTELDNNPREYDDVFVGKLVLNKKGTVDFLPTNDMPIREFPTKDNKVYGAIEIYKKPEVNKATGFVYNNRYISGIDPFDQDASDTMSLGSIFVFDLWTDSIVCEYTGRPDMSDDFYEICRLILLYYNARANYENNLKGIYGYFSKMNCLYLLTETLQFLKDRDMIKGEKIGNTARGTNATTPINNYADSRLREWLLTPKVHTIKQDDNEVEVTLNNCAFLRNRALIKEMIAYNPDINVDRIRAIGMLMLLREDRIIYGGGKINKRQTDDKYLGNDKYFINNYNSIKKSHNKGSIQI